MFMIMNITLNSIQILYMNMKFYELIEVEKVNYFSNYESNGKPFWS